MRIKSIGTTLTKECGEQIHISQSACDETLSKLIEQNRQFFGHGVDKIEMVVHDHEASEFCIINLTQDSTVFSEITPF